MNRSTHVAALVLALSAAPAVAQEGEVKDQRPVRTRVALGPQLQPRFPGSDEYVFRPFVDLSRARGDDVFIFEAPDESAGLALLNSGGFSAGPAIGFQGKRRRRDLGADLPNVGFTVEAGAFVQFQLTPAVRVRAEARRGLGGHDGWIGDIGADYVARDGDKWLFSLGPRVTLTDKKYQRAYFGVRPEDAVPSGLPIYRPGGGVQSVGATAGLLYQFTERWGATGFVRYDRLIEDAGDSPVVRRFGSRDQFSGGIAATYTFGRR
jgi:outer membrane protein